MKHASFVMTALTLLLTVENAQAGVVTTRPGGTDLIDWVQLGPAYTTLSSPQNFISTGGITGLITDSGTLERRDQSTGGWNGAFAVGDRLIWNQGNDRPIELDFNTPLDQVGAQIQGNNSGPFTATISAFDSLGNSLGTFTEYNGTNTGVGDNSAIYIGIDAAGISKVTFGVSTPKYAGDFVINQVSLSADAAAVPEPATLTLLGIGIAGMAGYGWRWRKLGTVSA